MAEPKLRSAAAPTTAAQQARNVAIPTIAAVAVIVALQHAQAVLIPIALGILVSYMLSPLVATLARWHLPRVVGAGVAVTLLVGLLGVGVYTTTDDVMEIVASVPEAAQRIRDRVRAQRRDREGPLQQVQSAATEIEKAAQEAAQPVTAPAGVQKVQVVEPALNASDYLWMGGVGLAGFLGQFTVILFLVYFLLVTGDLYKRKIVAIAGRDPRQKHATIRILDEIHQQIESFIRVQVFTSLIVGLVTMAALWAFGVRQYVVWGILAGIFNSIPYMGPIVVTAGLGVVTFLQFDDLLKTAWVCGTAFAITSLEGFLLTPALMSRASQMNPVAIFIGLLFWTWVWGIWGTILAVPMLMMLKAICDHIDGLQPFGELLGE
jgi:predicted PurR-regulated permease PerM